MKKGKNDFILSVLIAVLLGFIIGIIAPKYAGYLSIVGNIFLRLMQMTIPLLVMGQIIQALSDIKPRDLTSIGFKTMTIFGVSSFLAAIWGIAFALIFQPGKGIILPQKGMETVAKQELSVSDTLLNFFPTNIFQSLSDGSLIQVIVFSLFAGASIAIYQQKNGQKSYLGKLISEINAIVMEIIRLVMKIAPVGVLCLVASTISKTGISVILPLIKYLLVFSVATLIFMGIWILMVKFYCHRRFRDILYGIKDMSILAISTTSSAVTLPLEMKDAHEKLKISKWIVDLVLPLGVSLNSNGAAMHMAITVITVSQFYHHQFSFAGLVYIVVLSTLVSLANAVVPGASLVSLAIIIPQVGLPLESIAVFAGVDYFVGMIRTILNVTSDVFSAMIVEQNLKKSKILSK